MEKLFKLFFYFHIATSFFYFLCDQFYFHLKRNDYTKTRKILEENLIGSNLFYFNLNEKLLIFLFLAFFFHGSLRRIFLGYINHPHTYYIIKMYD